MTVVVSSYSHAGHDFAFSTLLVSVFNGTLCAKGNLKFSYYFSHDRNYNVKVRVGEIDGSNGGEVKMRNHQPSPSQEHIHYRKILRRNEDSKSYLI